MFSPDVNAVWAAAAIGKIAVAVFSLRIREKHLLFVIYSWSSVLLTLVLMILSIRGLSVAYFWTYYAGGIVKDALLLAVLYEIAAPMFFPLWILPRPLAITSVMGLSIFSVVASIASHLWSSRHAQLVVSCARTCDKAATLIFLATVTAMLLISLYLRIPWLKPAAHITCGFGVYLLVDSTIFVALTSSVLDRCFQWIHLLGYLAAEAAWLIGMSGHRTDSLHASDADIRRFYRSVSACIWAQGVEGK